MPRLPHLPAMPCRSAALPRRLRDSSNASLAAARFLSLALLSLLLAGCGQPGGREPVSIAWDRDTCEYCRMTISDRAYAAQAWDEEGRRYHRFDDIGCLVNWLHERGWPPERTRLWVADHRHRDRVHWLDARTAWYRDGLRTPMDYGFGAVAEPEAGAVNFETARAQMLIRDERR